MPDTIGKVMRKARVDKEIALREHAKKMEIPPSALSGYEHDKAVPSDLILMRASHLLALDYQQLRDLRDNPPPARDHDAELRQAVEAGRAIICRRR